MLYQLILFLSIVVALIEGFPGHEEISHRTQAPNSGIEEETVSVKLYYESLCPDCIAEYPKFPPVVKKLGANIKLQTYPYGNAQTTKSNGKTVVKCQHGEAECYGNKLHACAIDYLQYRVSEYIEYNACLMSKRSNDHAADECGKSQGIDSQPIKSCAKGSKGLELLVFYGNESHKVKYPGVPYVLIDGTPMQDGEDLMTAVCEAFTNPPEACNEIPDAFDENKKYKTLIK